MIRTLNAIDCHVYQVAKKKKITGIMESGEKLNQLIIDIDAN